RFAGVNPKRDLVEIIELPPEQHPWFVGVQFHPEYKTTVETPHPLFVAFLAAAIRHAEAEGELAAPRAPSRTRPVRRASARLPVEGEA
ncbi:MAG: CTP synthase, partial [Bacteroidota bacterium]